jgi:hypothetical protein
LANAIIVDMKYLNKMGPKLKINIVSQIWAMWPWFHPKVFMHFHLFAYYWKNNSISISLHIQQPTWPYHFNAYLQYRNHHYTYHPITTLPSNPHKELWGPIFILHLFPCHCYHNKYPFTISTSHIWRSIVGLSFIFISHAYIVD